MNNGTMFDMGNNLEVVGWSPPESLVTKIAELPIFQQIHRIGSRNRAVLWYLCQADAKSPLTERQLDALVNVNNITIEGLSEMSLRERYYRLTFLIAVGLVEVDFDNAGERNFIVQDDVRDKLESLKRREVNYDVKA